MLFKKHGRFSSDYNCTGFAFYHTTASIVGRIIIHNICCLSQFCDLIEDLLLSLSLWFSVTNKMWVEVTHHFHVETIKPFTWFHTLFLFLNTKAEWNNKTFYTQEKDCPESMEWGKYQNSLKLFNRSMAVLQS